MATLTEMEHRIKLLNQRAYQLAEETILQTKEYYLNLNATQLAMGLQADKKPITLEGRHYTAYTMDLKLKYGIGLGKVVSHITMYQSGNFYNTLELYIDQKNIFVRSPVPYAVDLIKRTTSKVFGLTPEHKEEYAFGAFLNNLKPKVSEILKLDFV